MTAPAPRSALTPEKRRTLDALVERLFPESARTIGATAIGASAYIDAALGQDYAGHLSEYQAMLAAIATAAGSDFAALPAEAQDRVVADLAANKLPGLPAHPDRTAFDLLWRHTREGLFGDPAHGGNIDGAGWRAIGFPGAQFGYRADEQALDEAIAREPRSFENLPRSARLRDLPHLDLSKAGGLRPSPHAGEGSPQDRMRGTPADGVPSSDLASLGHLLPQGKKGTKDREADVVIVGGGAVGGFLAHRLVMAGLDVVLLEAGPARSGRERVMDEISATAFRNRGGAAKFNLEVPTWRTGPDVRARRAVMSQGLETALGGNSVAWGAVAMRFYEDDFRIRSATVARYGEARIPQGSTLADWPLSYADLAPFYDEAERLLGVSGADGTAAGNPFAAPRARPHAMPPLRTSGLGGLFAEAARQEGYHPFPLPAAILTEAYDGRHACTYCSFCSRFGCHVDAKASIQNTVLPAALASGRLRLVTGAHVLDVVTDESGRAVGVRYRAEGKERFQGGGTVVLATYAFENTRLLLLSKTKRHGRGLGNETGEVGRHYMTRQQPSVYALFAGRKLNRFIGPTAQATAIADLSADHFDHAGLDFIRGGRIAVFNQYLPVEASGVLPPDVPRWGAAWRDFVIDHYNATAMLFIDPEILPYETNRLDLDPEVVDGLGRPVTRITFDIGENEQRLIAYLQARAQRVAAAMGATRTWQRPALTGPISTHDVGGTRMGHDPRHSVVDGFGAVHDTPGLFALGGSTFVSLPAVNPALTILALALRGATAIKGAAS